MPVDSELSTAAARMVMELFGQVSTRMPLLADCDAVTWSTVIADDDSNRTPARFGRFSERLLMTTFCRLLVLTPKDCAPASIRWPSPGLAPPVST